MLRLKKFLSGSKASNASSAPPLAGERPIALLAVSQDAAQCAVLRQIADDMAWTFSQAVSVDDAAAALAAAASAIVIFDRDLTDVDWRQALPRLADMPQTAGALLASRVADEYLWMEVSRRQGHDILRKPFQREEVIRAVLVAWSWPRVR